MRTFIIATLSLAVMAGCAGKVDYNPPTSSVTARNWKTINKPRESAWQATVAGLGKEFFIINNIDKASGLIILSYSGDPEAYVDCGYIVSSNGERFPASRAHLIYDTVQGLKRYSIDRSLSLEGRMNILFEELNPATTRVTVTARYILNRSLHVYSRGLLRKSYKRGENDSITFGSGSDASFTPRSGGPAEKCVATGALEQSIFAIVD